jgi:hypothetical protein
MKSVQFISELHVLLSVVKVWTTASYVMLGEMCVMAIFYCYSGVNGASITAGVQLSWNISFLGDSEVLQRGTLSNKTSERFPHSWDGYKSCLDDSSIHAHCTGHKTFTVHRSICFNKYCSWHNGLRRAPTPFFISHLSQLFPSLWTDEEVDGRNWSLFKKIRKSRMPTFSCRGFETKNFLQVDLGEILRAMKNLELEI